MLTTSSRTRLANRIQSLSEAERMQWQTNLGLLQNLRKELAELRRVILVHPKAELAKHTRRN